MTETPMSEKNTQVKQRNPYTPWFVIASFVLPVALAYVMFYFVDITSFTNKGEILNPILHVDDWNLRDETGVLIPKDKLTYKWRIFSFVGSSCDENCNKRLYEIRQVHTGLGKDQHRLFRVIVHLDKADAALTELIETEYKNTLKMYADEKELSDAINNNAQLRNNEIYIMDPRGNIMMRFTNEQPIADVRKDLRKLLKASQIG